MIVKNTWLINVHDALKHERFKGCINKVKLRQDPNDKRIKTLTSL